MRYMTRSEFLQHKQYGKVRQYMDFDGKHPEWRGRTTVMAGDDGPGTKLFIEGVSFEIVPDDDLRAPKQYRVEYISRLSGFALKKGLTYVWARGEEEAKKKAEEICVIAGLEAIITPA